MSQNKKIFYGDRFEKTVNEDISGVVTPPGPGPQDVFTFDRTDITFDSTIRTFDEAKV